MIIGKKVKVEVKKQDMFVGASGSIEISNEEEGSLYLHVDGGPSIGADLRDVLEVINRSIIRKES